MFLKSSPRRIQFTCIPEAILRHRTSECQVRRNRRNHIMPRSPRANSAGKFTSTFRRHTHEHVTTLEPSIEMNTEPRTMSSTRRSKSSGPTRATPRRRKSEREIQVSGHWIRVQTASCRSRTVKHRSCRLTHEKMLSISIPPWASGKASTGEPWRCPASVSRTGWRTNIDK